MSLKHTRKKADIFLQRLITLTPGGIKSVFYILLIVLPSRTHLIRFTLQGLTSLRHNSWGDPDASDSSLPSCLWHLFRSRSTYSIPVHLCDCVVKLASHCLLLATLASIANQLENRQHHFTLYCMHSKTVQGINWWQKQCNQVCKSI